MVMRIIKNIIVAFSLYSRIPMPVFEWKEEDMKHNLIFLPWIGGVIGAICFGVNILFGLKELPLICRLAVFSVIPLIVTGGFHVDGFMDVQDALKSYKSKEEKLEILKDPHIGAFAVIRLVIYGLIWVAALAVVCSSSNVNYRYLFFTVFAFARSVMGLLSLMLKKAKKTGMLNMETKKASMADKVFLIIQAAVCIGIAGWINVLGAVMFLMICLGYVLVYRHICYKQFGGVTGDTTGYGLVSLEEALLIGIAALCIIGW